MKIQEPKLIKNLAASFETLFCERPKLFKVALVVNHLFRAACMAALMSSLPFSPIISCALGLASSLFYRVSIERLCPIRFSLTACFGATCFMIAKTSTVVGSLAFSAYVITIIHFANEDVNALNSRSCCAVKNV